MIASSSAAARRTLCQWLLAAVLERGVDPILAARRHRWGKAVATRALSRSEAQAFLRPLSNVSFLPRPRPVQRAG